jgi:Flp pilus assembly protein TadD
MSADYYMALADALAHDGRLAESLRAYQQLLRLDPWNPYAYAGKALVLRRLEHYDQARAAVMAISACAGYARRGAHASTE